MVRFEQRAISESAKFYEADIAGQHERASDIGSEYNSQPGFRDGIKSSATVLSDEEWAAQGREPRTPEWYARVNATKEQGEKRKIIPFDRYLPSTERSYFSRLRVANFDVSQAEKLADMTYDGLARFKWAKDAEGRALEEWKEKNKPI